MLTLLAIAAAAVFVGQLLLVLWHRSRDPGRFLAELPLAEPADGWPKLAVLVAARNEEEHVTRAVASLLALDYPALSVVAVDDRSTDGTGAALAKLAAGDPRLSVIRVDLLPPGWLGKTHALQKAWEGAKGAGWILLTDADVVLAPDALKRVVAHAEGAGPPYDHVTVYPDIRFDSAGEAMFLAFFGVAFSLQMPIWAVESRRSKAYLGIGAFNLVRSSALARLDGFQSLRLSVDDDMRLGEALKAHGYRTRVLLGRGTVSLKWQPDALGYVRGLEKNAFASLEFNYVRVAAALGGLVLIGLVPYLAVALGGAVARIAGLTAIAATVGLVALGRRSSAVPARYALTAPMASFLLGAALVLSVLKTNRRGGIVWRDTLYPLAELKAHVATRRAWNAAAWKART